MNTKIFEENKNKGAKKRKPIELMLARFPIHIICLLIINHEFFSHQYILHIKKKKS